MKRLHQKIFNVKFENPVVLQLDLIKMQQWLKPMKSMGFGFHRDWNNDPDATYMEIQNQECLDIQNI